MSSDTKLTPTITLHINLYDGLAVPSEIRLGTTDNITLKLFVDDQMMSEKLVKADEVVQLLNNPQTVKALLDHIGKATIGSYLMGNKDGDTSDSHS